MCSLQRKEVVALSVLIVVGFLAVNHYYIFQHYYHGDVGHDVKSVPLALQLDEVICDEGTLPVRDLLTTSYRRNNITTYNNDSRAFIFMKDPFDYNVCRFHNVCANSSHWMFHFDNGRISNEMLRSFRVGCSKGQVTNRPAICSCLPFPWVQPIVVEPTYASSLPYYSGHSWISDKLVGTHHIGHWAMKLVLMHSILEHQENYGLLSIQLIAFLRSRLKLSSHEQNLLEIAIKALPSNGIAMANSSLSMKENISTIDVPILGRSDFDMQRGICFEKASTSKMMEIYASNQHDAHAWRVRSYRHYGLHMSPSHCPPKRVVYLYREEPKTRRRVILNSVDVEAALCRVLGINTIEHVTVTRLNSSLEQAALFSSFGLLVTAHSSQLANLIFAQRNASVVEIKPFFFNSVFAKLGRTFGLDYHFALGGRLASGTPLSDGARSCDFDKYVRGACQKEKIWTPWINEDFSADISAVTHAAEAVKLHIESVCGSIDKWQSQ